MNDDDVQERWREYLNKLFKIRFYIRRLETREETALASTFCCRIRVAGVKKAFAITKTCKSMGAMWHSDRGLEILKRAFSSCIYLNCQHSHFATHIFCMLFSNWPTLCPIFCCIGHSYLIVV